ncbi:MAG: glutamate-5-semialdehyde dehydrogenase [Candidatus Moranbacteria bacterium]|nr:glutamate-5-semialdehyde dehydrogenase [Candidatus Moranbacteria bacterium]
MNEQKNYQTMTSNNLTKGIARAKKYSVCLLALKKSDRKNVLLQLAKILKQETVNIIKKNKKDIEIARENGHIESFIERLELDKNKIRLMADSLSDLAILKDILFKTIREKDMTSGIHIKKISVPLGLIAMIYESRPNVTIDAFAMAFKSGNAIILKGGKEIQNTNKILVSLVKKALKKFSINPNIIQDFSGIDKNLSLQLISNQKIDCLIPRGGKNLIKFIRENAKVPTIITGASVVHIYVDESADLELAKKVIVNAKTRRVSICNALDVLLINKKIYKKILAELAPLLVDKNVTIIADKVGYDSLKKINYALLRKADKNDFDTEFLDYTLAVKIVDNLGEAINHIQKHSLGHSEAIITKSKVNIDSFFQNIDAACLYLNTSTQFSDGEEFGMGGEIGISTQKLHARGPFAYSELTTYKYLVTSNGAIRK